MIIVKTKHGEFKYKNWQWNIAWTIVYLAGIMLGMFIGQIL